MGAPALVGLRSDQQHFDGVLTSIHGAVSARTPDVAHEAAADALNRAGHFFAAGAAGASDAWERTRSCCSRCRRQLDPEDHRNSTSSSARASGPGPGPTTSTETSFRTIEQLLETVEVSDIVDRIFDKYITENAEKPPQRPRTSSARTDLGEAERTEHGLGSNAHASELPMTPVTEQSVTVVVEFDTGTPCVLDEAGGSRMMMPTAHSCSSGYGGDSDPDPEPPSSPLQSWRASDARLLGVGADTTDTSASPGSTAPSGQFHDSDQSPQRRYTAGDAETIARMQTSQASETSVEEFPPEVVHAVQELNQLDGRTDAEGVCDNEASGSGATSRTIRMERVKDAAGGLNASASGGAGPLPPADVQAQTSCTLAQVPEEVFINDSASSTCSAAPVASLESALNPTPVPQAASANLGDASLPVNDKSGVGTAGSEVGPPTSVDAEEVCPATEQGQLRRREDEQVQLVPPNEFKDNAVSVVSGWNGVPMLELPTPDVADNMAPSPALVMPPSGVPVVPPVQMTPSAVGRTGTPATAKSKVHGREEEPSPPSSVTHGPRRGLSVEERGGARCAAVLVAGAARAAAGARQVFSAAAGGRCSLAPTGAVTASTTPTPSFHADEPVQVMANSSKNTGSAKTSKLFSQKVHAALPATSAAEPSSQGTSASASAGAQEEEGRHPSLTGDASARIAQLPNSWCPEKQAICSERSECTHAVHRQNNSSKRGTSAPADPSRMGGGNCRRERRLSTEKRHREIVPDSIVGVASRTTVHARGRAAPDGCPVTAEGEQQQQAVEGGAAVCPSPTYTALRAREGSFRTPRNRDRARNEKAPLGLQDVSPEPEDLLLLQSAPRPAPEERISMCNAIAQSHTASRREHPKLCSLFSGIDAVSVIPNAFHQHDISNLLEADVEEVSLEEAPVATPAETPKSVVTDGFGRPSSTASVTVQGTPSPCAGDAGCNFECPGSNDDGVSKAALAVGPHACPEAESDFKACLLQPCPDGEYDLEFRRLSQDSTLHGGNSGQLHIVVDSDDGTTPATSVTALDDASSYHSLIMAQPGDSPTSFSVRSQIASDPEELRLTESLSKLTREIVLRAGLQAASAKPLSGRTTPDSSTGSCVQRRGNRTGSSDETPPRHLQEHRQCGKSSRSTAPTLTVQPRELICAPTLSQSGLKTAHRKPGSRQTSRPRTIASTPSPASSNRSDSVARLAQLPEYQQVNGQAASKSRITKSRDNHPKGESPQVIRVALDESVHGVRQTLKAKSSASHSRDLPWNRPSGSSRSDAARKLASSSVAG